MVVDLTSVLLVTRPLLHPQRSWRGPLGEASRRRPVLVQAGSHTMEGMKRKKQDERLNGQPDCGRQGGGALGSLDFSVGNTC